MKKLKTIKSNIDSIVCQIIGTKRYPTFWFSTIFICTSYYRDFEDGQWVCYYDCCHGWSPLWHTNYDIRCAAISITYVCMCISLAATIKLNWIWKYSQRPLRRPWFQSVTENTRLIGTYTYTFRSYGMHFNGEFASFLH